MIHDIKLVTDGCSRWSQGTFELARRNWDRNSKEENFQNNPEGIYMRKEDTQGKVSYFTWCAQCSPGSSVPQRSWFVNQPL